MDLGGSFKYLLKMKGEQELCLSLSPSFWFDLAPSLPERPELNEEDYGLFVWPRDRSAVSPDGKYALLWGEGFNFFSLIEVTSERQLEVLREGRFVYKPTCRFSTGWLDPRGVFGKSS